MRINHAYPIDIGVHEAQHNNSWLCQDVTNCNIKGKDGCGNIWIIISFVGSKWAETSLKYKILEKGILCEKGKFTVLGTCT